MAPLPPAPHQPPAHDSPIDPYRLSMIVGSTDAALAAGAVPDDPVTIEVLEAARRLVDIYELVTRLAGQYQARDSYTNHPRRDAQTITAAEVLRLLEGDHRCLEQLRERGAPALSLDELPQRLGGRRP